MPVVPLSGVGPPLVFPSQTPCESSLLPIRFPVPRSTLGSTDLAFPIWCLVQPSRDERGLMEVRVACASATGQ